MACHMLACFASCLLPRAFAFSAFRASGVVRAAYLSGSARGRVPGCGRVRRERDDVRLGLAGHPPRFSTSANSHLSVYLSVYGLFVLLSTLRTRSLEVFLSYRQKYFRVCACCLFAPPVCLVWTRFTVNKKALHNRSPGKSLSNLDLKCTRSKGAGAGGTCE